LLDAAGYFQAPRCRARYAPNSARMMLFAEPLRHSCRYAAAMLLMPPRRHAS